MFYPCHSHPLIAYRLARVGNTPTRRPPKRGCSACPHGRFVDAPDAPQMSDVIPSTDEDVVVAENLVTAIPADIDIDIPRFGPLVAS